MASRLKAFQGYLLERLYEPPAKTLLLIVCLTFLFFMLSYMMYAYEYVMNSNLFVHFGMNPITNMFNEGVIGYTLLISMGVCAVFWVKYWLKLPIQIKSYMSLEDSETCTGGER